MNMDLSRRGFLKRRARVWRGRRSARWASATSRPRKRPTSGPSSSTSTTETRNTCPYCSVACGVIMYSKGDLTKGEAAEIIHIEGDVDHPTNRGTLCPKGAALLDFVHVGDAADPADAPQARQRTSFEPISWDEALDRIARLMKDDRDANFVANERRRRDRSTAGRPPASSPLRRPPTRRRC